MVQVHVAPQWLAGHCQTCAAADDDEEADKLLLMINIYDLVCCRCCCWHERYDYEILLCNVV
jgi:hypothetical protein